MTLEMVEKQVGNSRKAMTQQGQIFRVSKQILASWQITKQQNCTKMYQVWNTESDHETLLR